jgi:hypothetical protein
MRYPDNPDAVERCIFLIPFVQTSGRTSGLGPSARKLCIDLEAAGVPGLYISERYRTLPALEAFIAQVCLLHLPLKLDRYKAF